MRVHKQATLPVIVRGDSQKTGAIGTVYLSVDRRVNRSLGLMKGDVVTIGIIDLQRPAPEEARTE